jgi:pSer/pThr/pTyr-binding forkhead associated (FHA) protein
MAYVVVTLGDRLIGRYELRTSLSIGRSPDSDVLIPDIQVSRQHCEIEQTREGWVVRDMDSRNGTYVGGMSVGQFVLDDGDEIRVGNATIKFCVGALPPTRPSDPSEALGNVQPSANAGAVHHQPNAPKPMPRPWSPGGAPSSSEDVNAGSTGVFGNVTVNNPADKKKS